MDRVLGSIFPKRFRRSHLAVRPLPGGPKNILLGEEKGLAIYGRVHPANLRQTRINVQFIRQMKSPSNTCGEGKIGERAKSHSENRSTFNGDLGLKLILNKAATEEVNFDSRPL